MFEDAGWGQKNRIVTYAQSFSVTAHYTEFDYIDD